MVRITAKVIAAPQEFEVKFDDGDFADYSRVEILTGIRAYAQAVARDGGGEDEVDEGDACEDEAVDPW